MKNSSQSPAGFNIVNFPSQLEKIKERRGGQALSCRDWVVSVEGSGWGG